MNQRRSTQSPAEAPAKNLEGNQSNTQYSPSNESPVYTPPQKGLLALLPTSWVPYAELMRLDRPAGFYAFYVPYLIGLGYAACLAQSVPSLPQLLYLCGIFFLFCIVLRGAACTWNDNVDQGFDRQVARTRFRPIARGAVSTTQAHVFTVALLLAQIPFAVVLPAACTYQIVAVNFAFAGYALMKRITYYPQVVLGFPFAWAIFICCSALEVNPISSDLILATMSIFVANIIWTVIYDTIYAHQDIRDDVKAGVKSMAIRFGDNTKAFAAGLAAIQIALLILTGTEVGFSYLYFLGTCGGTAVTLGSMLVKVDLKEPSSCAWFFHQGFWYVGGSMAMGLAAEYFARICH
ncbi:MAG: hypothetical protein Q9191_006894 [Dirinaria sp. TL-2023a]